jgi:K+-sensing histidine kinase KdpD
MRIGLLVTCLGVVGGVGYVDSRLPELSFALFYLIPVFLSAWYLGRLAGVGLAAASAGFGLAADLVSDHADVGYAYANSGFRFALLLVVALTVSRLHEAMDRERQAAAAQATLMRSVAADAQTPLGDIYARVVDLGFDLNVDEAAKRELVGEIVRASGKLGRLVRQLEASERDATDAPAERQGIGP